MLVSRLYARLIYVEEEKNRIIIERVAGEPAKLAFLNDTDVKDEPIFDQANDPQPLVREIVQRRAGKGLD